ARGAGAAAGGGGPGWAGGARGERSALGGAPPRGEQPPQSEEQQLRRAARLARARALHLVTAIGQVAYLDAAGRQERPHLLHFVRAQIETPLGVPTPNDCVGDYLDSFTHRGGTLPRTGPGKQEEKREDSVTAG